MLETSESKYCHGCAIVQPDFDVDVDITVAGPGVVAEDDVVCNAVETLTTA